MDRSEIFNTALPSDASGKEALIWLGELAIIHATGKETHGRYAMVELYATKEGEAPWHVHHREDEAFYIMEGEITVYVGEKVIKGRPGDFIFAPKDVPHMYTVDTPGHARILMVFSPAGFEGFVRGTSVQAKSLVPPLPETINIDYEQVVKLAEQFGAEFVEPPTGANV
jgi:quercetin dioxygenase-like cupin family protein